MVIVAKDPTKTETIVAGWENPSNALSKDGLYTRGYALHAEQEYSGYGFDLPFGVKINKVVVKSQLYATSSDDILVVKIWDGLAWYEKRIDKYTTPSIPLTPTDISLDFTNVTNWTAGKVNNIRTRIYYAYYTPASVYVDNLTVEVDYTTTEEKEEAIQETVAQFIKAYWKELSVLAVIIAIVIAIILGVW